MMLGRSKRYSNGSWVIDDQVTTKEILGSDQFSVQRAGGGLNTGTNDGLGDDRRIIKGLLRQSVVFLDGSKHQKIKRAVSNDFQGKLDAIVRDTAEQLQNRQSNLISDLAKIIPARSIAYLLGSLAGLLTYLLISSF